MPQFPVGTVSAPDALIFATYGRRVLDFRNIMQRGLDDISAVGLNRLRLGLLHLHAVRIVLVDRIDLRAENALLLHDLHESFDADERVADRAKEPELTFAGGQIVQLRADAVVDNLFAGISEIVLSHVFVDLSGDERGRARDDDPGAIRDRGAQLSEAPPGVVWSSYSKSLIGCPSKPPSAFTRSTPYLIPSAQTTPMSAPGAGRTRSLRS